MCNIAAAKDSGNSDNLVFTPRARTRDFRNFQNYQGVLSAFWRDAQDVVVDCQTATIACMRTLGFARIVNTATIEQMRKAVLRCGDGLSRKELVLPRLLKKSIVRPSFLPFLFKTLEGLRWIALTLGRLFGWLDLLRLGC
jgi:hypothetical protein